jgi:pyridoxal phosphate enzyme (YggS family)
MVNVKQFNDIRKTLNEKGVNLIAVSKTKPIEAIFFLYNEGQRIFGENRVQELTAKYDALPKDIQWHLIGHLQSNKVKYIAPFVSLIHSVDSLSLLSEINRQALKNNRIINCLLQFHVAVEETKYGLNIEEAEQLLNSDEYRKMKNIRIEGVMGMASFSNDEDAIRKEFSNLSNIFEKLKALFFNSEDTFCEISMGMSGDYQIAVDEGSTMVRIGSLLFGER